MSFFFIEGVGVDGFILVFFVGVNFAIVIG
jgi:hypothetical protein